MNVRGCTVEANDAVPRHHHASIFPRQLLSLISVTATVVRDGEPTKVAVSRLVPGDVVRLAAGDMVPTERNCVLARGSGEQREVNSQSVT